jgi:HK97 family phage portal protein
VQIGPFTIARTKALQLSPLSQSGNGWFPWGIIRESFSGAWQTNTEIRVQEVITNPTLFACVTLIAADVAKLCLRLVEEDSDGVWTPIESAAFSPVLRTPNRYQIITKFIEQWLISKLTQGNTYVLLERDNRRVVRAMYVLDPSRVTPLVTPMGDVYYQLKRDDLSQLAEDSVTVPASEIIHDRMICLFHPLVGVTPIYACGMAALQGLTIQRSSSNHFANASQPGVIITAPAGITDVQALALKTKWETEFGGDNAGKVAIIGGELKFNQLSQNAVDSQLIEQLKWGDERICSTYHVPAYMVGVGPPPPYANVEPLLQAYHAQCIQSLLTNAELCLDGGLGLSEKIDGKRYGTEFDITDLIWMDTTTKTAAAQGAISSGSMSPDEARKRYYGLGKVKGGNTPYMQQQMYSLAALAERDADKPFTKPTPQLALPPAKDDTDDDASIDMAANFEPDFFKAFEEGLRA